MMLKASCILVAATLAAGTALADNRDHGYRLVELDFPGAGSLGTSFYDINDEGTAVGNWANGDVVDAFIYEHGEFVDLTAPGAVGWSELLGINNRGFAVGDFSDAAGIFHPFTRAPDGTMTVLPDPAPDNALTELTGVNDEGVIVGVYGTDSELSTCTGFIYRRGRYHFIQRTGSTCTIPTGINDFGQIVGIYYDAADVRHSFLLEPGEDIDHAREIDVGQNSTRPFHITNLGLVVGWYADPAGGVHGYYQHLGGAAHTVDFPGASDTRLLGANDRGVLVGTFNFFSGGLLAIPLDR